MVLMSGSRISNEKYAAKAFLKDESGWTDFFITRIGLIIFAAVLLLSAFKIYPMFQEKETLGYLDAIASDLTSKIEAVDSTTIPGYRYLYTYDGKNNIEIEISTEYVLARTNMSTGIWGEHEILHAEQIVTHVYPSNAKWSNTSDFRIYISEAIGKGSNGGVSSPLNFSSDKERVDLMFGSIKSELARAPFRPDPSKPLNIEKVIIYYTNHTDLVERDYVFIYQ